MRKLIAAALGASALVAAGSAAAFPFPSFQRTAAKSGDVGSVVYRATDRLIANMRPRPGKAGILTPEDQVIVATIVSVDDLAQSSTFGRLTSQLVLSRLSQMGYQVRDITYLGGLEMSPGGERILSRDAQRLSRNYSAAAVVAGTYAVAGQQIIVNLRLLSADDGQLVSSTDFSVPLNMDTWPLVSAKAPRLTLSPEAILYGAPYPTR